MRMIANNIHKIKPQRTCTKTYSNYVNYKPYLREDFAKRCGYCDDLDLYAGGSRGYQIDHFKPQKHFPNLKNNYSNLVYSCPFCNRAKWHKWINPKGFIDPCNAGYDNHLNRNNKGQICYKTDQGKYIYDNLMLGLKRHELLWMIDILKEQKEIFSAKLENISSKNNRFQVLEAFYEIQTKIDDYITIFEDSI